MMIQFVLIAERTSDEGLLSHLESVLIHLGADEVSGIALDRRRLPEQTGASVESRLSAAMHLEPTANLFLIHRDADSIDPEPRYQEIQEAVSKCQFNRSWIAIVPVQETEAWLLLNEDAIRRVAGKPSSRVPLSLPLPRAVESVARPKEVLQAAITTASQTTGRRRAGLTRDFPIHRQILLRSLPIGGALNHVASWRRMMDDLKSALAGLDSSG